MIKKYVEEALKKHGLSQEKLTSIMVDFIEELLDDGLLVDNDVMVFFEEALAEEAKKVQRLDADTKEVVKFLFDKGIFVKRPVNPQFQVENGVEYACFDIEEDRLIPRVVKVWRSSFNKELAFSFERKRLPVNNS